MRFRLPLLAAALLGVMIVGHEEAAPFEAASAGVDLNSLQNEAAVGTHESSSKNDAIDGVAPSSTTAPAAVNPCDAPADANGDRAISLADVGYLLSVIGHCDTAPFTATCYFTDEDGLWVLRSDDVWPLAFDNAEVFWWQEINDVRTDWRYFTELTVSGGVAYSAIVDGDLPAGGGDIYAGVVQLDGTIDPYVASCEFAIP